MVTSASANVVMHLHHRKLLQEIRKHAGKPARDAFLNNYLGNDHVRYSINTPTLRAIAKEWAKKHRDLSASELTDVITSLVEGKSFTEKVLAGIILGYSAVPQRNFDPGIFDQWLDHLVGWAEIDALCTGDFAAKQVPADWPKWKKLITRLSKSTNINKRRASLVLFCSPLSKAYNPELAAEALRVVDRLKSEKEIIITKAISWVLRSLVKFHRREVADYLDYNAATLPRIAVRETNAKLNTGRKVSRQ